MANDNDRLVVAYYANVAAAEAAAEGLKNWDDADDDIKLGAIGIITLNPENDEIEVKEIGQRSTKKGALWGTAIGAGLAILSGGLTLIPGLIGGAAIGGGLGFLNHKSLGMSDEDVADLAEHLKHGGAALGVMCDDFEVAATTTKLVQEGGRTAHFVLAEEAAEALTEAAEAQKEASTAVEEAVEEAAENVEEAKRAVAVELPDADETKAEAVIAIAAAGGLAAADASKLHDAGVDKASALLEQGATPAGRAELAAETGVAEESILTVVKRLDLMRINGVGVIYAELLQVSGVETVPDLARRNATNLTAAMAEKNKTAQIAKELPTEETVTDWVGQAKDLPRVITY